MSETSGVRTELIAATNRLAEESGHTSADEDWERSFCTVGAIRKALDAMCEAADTLAHRKRAVEALVDRWREQSDNPLLSDEEQVVYDQCADALDALNDPERSEVSGWRPIETAPKDGTQVLVSGIGLGRWISTARYHGGCWWDEDGPGSLTDVTHWMPLPEPPGESERSEVEGG